MVISCSLANSSSLLSMSKMPPQGSCSIPQVLYLFFSHAANINNSVRYEHKRGPDVLGASFVLSAKDGCLVSGDQELIDKAVQVGAVAIQL